MKLFFSYGHDDNDPIVTRLEQDLSQDHQVWIDRTNIRAGDDWRHRILEGLGEADLVFGFLSKHSVRDPGVCRDELSIALGPFGKPVATILLEADAEPPISISHVQWIDMTAWKAKFNTPDFAAWYGEKLAEVRSVLASDQIQRFAEELKALMLILNPVEHNDLVNRLIEGFVGRHWLFDRLRDWQKQNLQSRMLWVSGTAGTGKSAFMASLAYFNRANVIGINLCDYKSQDRSNAHSVIRTLAYQIATRIADYRKLILGKLQHFYNPTEEIAKKNPHDLFDFLLVNIKTLDGGRSDDRCLVLIDALDETLVAQKSELMEVLAKNAAHLPSWLAIVVSSRPEEAIKTTFSALKPLEIEAGSQENQEDIKTYIAAWLKDNHQDVTHLNDILAAAEGNFLYVRMLTEAVRNGTIVLGHSALPGGLSAIYHAWFDHRFADKAAYARLRPALEVLLAAKGVVPEHWLLRLSHLDYDDLAPLGSLIENRQGGFAFFHKSLSDWLASPDNRRFGVSRTAGQKTLLAAQWPVFLDWAKDVGADPQALDPFVIDELPHLITHDHPETQPVIAKMALDWDAIRLNTVTIPDVLAKTYRWPMVMVWYQAIITLCGTDPSNANWQRDQFFSLIKIGTIEERMGRMNAAMTSFEKGFLILEPLVASDPTNASLQRDLMLLNTYAGNILVQCGITDDALSLFEECIMIGKTLISADPTNNEWQLGLANTYDSIGHIELNRHRLDEAIAAYQMSNKYRQVLANIESTNSNYLYCLSVSYLNIGDVEQARGRWDEAMTFFDKAMSNMKSLAKADTTNTDWLGTLMRCYDRIGYIDTRCKRFDAAINSFAQGLKIAQNLTAYDPTNTKWQHSLSVFFDRIGDIEIARDCFDEAMIAFQQGFKVKKTLTEFFYNNAIWQRDLSVSYNKIGYIEMARDRLDEAMIAFQQSLSITQALAVVDSTNTDWQVCLSNSYRNIGHIERAWCRWDEAMTAFVKGLTITQALVQVNPNEAEWQHDLSISFDAIGNIEFSRGRLDEAMTAYVKGLTIIQALAQVNPNKAEWQYDLSVFFDAIGNIEFSRGRLDEAMTAYVKGLTIRQALAISDPINSKWQRCVMVSFIKLANIINDYPSWTKVMDQLLAMRAKNILAPKDAHLIDIVQQQLDRVC